MFRNMLTDMCVLCQRLCNFLQPRTFFGRSYGFYPFITIICIKLILTFLLKHCGSRSYMWCAMCKNPINKMLLFLRSFKKKCFFIKFWTGKCTSNNFFIVWDLSLGQGKLKNKKPSTNWRHYNTDAFLTNSKILFLIKYFWKYEKY